MRILISIKDKTKWLLMAEKIKKVIDFTYVRHLRGILVVDTPDLKPEDWDKLRRIPGVSSVLPDLPVKKLDDPLGSRYRWDMTLINADNAVSNMGTPTSSVKVAVLDTGYRDDHPDIPTDKVAEALSFVPAESGTYNETHAIDTPTTGASHGTHVLGIIGAKSNNLGTVGYLSKWGVDVSYYIYRVLDDSGSGTFSSTLQALNRAINQGVHVVNMSLGMDSYPDLVATNSANASLNPDVLTAYRSLFDSIRDAGIILCIASGNSRQVNSPGLSPQYCLGFPAILAQNYPNIVSVGSVYYNGQQATGAPYSQWGKGLKVILPGGYASSMDVNYDSFKDSILSPSYSRSSGSGYYWMEGTSMACPVATSIVALIKATRPSSSASAYNKAIAVINVLYNLTGYVGASAETLPADQQRGWGMPSFS